MLEIFSLLFTWLPSGISSVALAFVGIFVLVFFAGIILKVIQIIRG